MFLQQYHIDAVTGKQYSDSEGFANDERHEEPFPELLGANENGNCCC